MPSRFSLQVTTKADDIDEVNHVSNLVYLRWVQDIAVAHSAELGWPFSRYRAHGAIFVVRRHELDYVAPVLLGEVVRLETWVESLKAASCVRRTEIVRERDSQVVCRGKTLWAFVSFEDGRPQRIPEEIRKAFGAALAEPGPGG
ncbi:MAG: thioesterase family protein [Kofleriaceae bacterium]